MGIFCFVLGVLGEVIYIAVYKMLLFFRVNLVLSFFYAFCDLVIGEAEHRTVAFFWLVASGVIYAFCEYMRYSDKYRELLRRHEDLRIEHECVQKYNKKYANPKYWFSLIQNPKRGEIVIATNGIEKYVSGINFDD